MKNLRFFIGIVIVLAIVCSPVLAISKADLLAQPSIKPTSTPSLSKIDLYKADLIAQYSPSTPLDFIDIPCNCFDAKQSLSQPQFRPKPTPTPSPLTLDTDVFSPYGWWSDYSIPALVPSYYEYSKFPAPEPFIYVPYTDKEWEEMMANAYEHLNYTSLIE